MNRNMIALAALFMGLFSLVFVVGKDSGEHVVRLAPHTVVMSEDDESSSDPAAEMIAMEDRDSR